MASLIKPYSDGDYVIGPGQAFFVVSSPAREPGISIRRRRRLRGKRKADLRAAGLPEDGIVPLGEASVVRDPPPPWLAQGEEWLRCYADMRTNPSRYLA
ncbi:hypothetical protein OKC48_07410 [Methylorubrum extorquens]|uniref:hypothetical protein n=1 Tax=Methylorubrum extorquens TaxID=408 RepID=UPI0022374D13|nr:hypothetical protein [Methylorubrum extorquens]UYW28333.1 hypothetical protein OKC48_07410 [Methylorubrum extorquens]